MHSSMRITTIIFFCRRGSSLSAAPAASAGATTGACDDASLGAPPHPAAPNSPQLLRGRTCVSENSKFVFLRLSHGSSAGFFALGSWPQGTKGKHHHKHENFLVAPGRRSGPVWGHSGSTFRGSGYSFRPKTNSGSGQGRRSGVQT